MEAARGNGGGFEAASTLAPVKAVLANGAQEFTTHHPDGAGGRRRNATTWDREKGRARSDRSTAYFLEACRLQGIPEGFDLPPFTVQAKIKAVGNGVPYPLARAVARAVREALS